MRCRTGVPVIGSPAVAEQSSLRHGLSGGRRLVGTVVTLPDVVLAELTASAVDFVWIDLEHGALGLADVAPLAIAARAGGAASLVRLRDASDQALGPALDAGVAGVVVPRVESAEQAEAVVARLRHPPRGSRGRAARRDLGYGRDDSPRAEAVCMVQIESAGAVEEAAAIAAVDGVDALVVGCADLAASMGVGAHATAPAGAGPDDARLARAVRRVQRAAADAGVASGMAGPGDPDALARLADGRSTVTVLAADVRIYASALDERVARLRDALARCAPEMAEAHVGT
jgi:4-hydroxy-2-oxoheptanedioate aldolase